MDKRNYYQACLYKYMGKYGYVSVFEDDFYYKEFSTEEEAVAAIRALEKRHDLPRKAIVRLWYYVHMENRLSHVGDFHITCDGSNTTVLSDVEYANR